jgi:hypothetical protein
MPFFIYLLAVLMLVFEGSNAQNISPYLTEKNFQNNQNYSFEIDGIINASLAKTNQKNIYEKNILPDNFSKNYINNNANIGLDNQVFAKGALKLNNSNYLGVTSKFELNFNTNSKNENPNLDQAFLYLDNNLGRFEFGNYVAVNQKMKYGPARFARGAGGINGKYLEYVNLPVLNQNSTLCNGNILSPDCANIKHPRFITLAQSPIGHGGYAKGFYPRDVDNFYNLNSKISDFNRTNFRALRDDSYEGLEDALKFSYYTKKINQIQLGASYAPVSSNQGFTAKTARDTNDIKLSNLLSFGINYSNDFDNLNISASSTAEYAKPQTKNGIARNELFSYDFGTSLSYFGFTLGSSFGSWGKSLYAKNGNYSCEYDYSKSLQLQNCDNSSNALKNSYYYTTGLAYQIGPINTSLTSINSSFQKNKYSAISFGIDYKIKKNLLTYFEITQYKFKSEQLNIFDLSNQIKVANLTQKIQNNNGKVFLTGIYYLF